MTAGVFMLGDINADPQSDEYTAIILLISIWYLIFVILGVAVLGRDDKELLQKSGKRVKYLLPVVFLAGIAIRVFIGIVITGYSTDMTCWTLWSEAAAGNGLFDIYADTSFLDYPPGYIYILHILGSIGKLAGIECFTPGYNILLKIPSILADMGIVWLLYRVGSKRLNKRIGFYSAMLYAINPLSILDSSAWGQIDGVLTLLVAGYLIALHKKNIFGETILFVIGLLVKPQMLFFGPVLAVVFILYIKERGWGKSLKIFFISLFGGIALFALTVFPFTGSKPWYWIFEKYLGTIGSYNYITLNSANLYGLLGLNWVPTETVKFGLSLSVWGIIGLGLTTVLYFVLSFLNKNRNNIFMLSAMLMTGIFTFGLKMHERYLFPVIVILLIAYIYDKRDSILVMFGVMTTALFINVAQVLVVTHIPPDDLLFKITSGTITASYLGLVIFCFTSVLKSRKDSKVNLREASD